jgi:nicotinamidase/pyrazinamidase
MKTIFWNVDTQYDFMRTNGKLYVPGAETIEGNLEKLTKLAEKNNFQVINTGDWHTKETKEISDKPDFINTFGEHCMANSSGAEYISATKPKDPYIINYNQKELDKKEVIDSRNLVIRKDSFDVFKGNPYTEKIIETIRPDRVIVYGVATNFCVDYAVTGLKEKGIEVYVVSDAIKEIPLKEEPKKTFDKWLSHDIKLLSTNQVMEMYQ